MNVNNVGQHLDRRVSTGTTRPAERASGGARDNLMGPQDFFENSGQLSRVRALIDQLVQVEDVRSEEVARGRALLDSGALDTPSSFARAAEAMLEA